MTSTAAIVAGVCRDQLSLPAADIDRNLLDLGADSLVMLSIARRLEQELGRTVSVVDVFRHPTIAALADHLDRTAPPAPGNDVAAADRVGSGDFDLSPTQRGLWLMQWMDESKVKLNLPFWTVLDEAVSPDDFRTAVNLLVERHDALRLVLVASRGGVSQHVLPHHEIAVPLVDVGDADDPEQALRERMRTENLVPFDFSRPLIRAVLYRLGPDRFRAYLNVHHLVADGLSLQILLADLKTLYRAVHAGDPSPPAPLPMTYEGCLRAEQQWQESPAGAEVERYWLDELAGPIPVLNLADLDGSGQPDVGCRRLTLDEARTAAVVAAGRTLGVTRNTLLLSAYLVVLNQLTGDDRIIVGMPHSGRHTPHSEHVVGLFLNSLPLYADLSGLTTFAEVVRLVHEKSVAAQAHSRFPFGRLVRALNPPRQGGRNPLYSTLFQHADFLPPPYMNPQLDVSVNSRYAGGRIDVQISYDEQRLTPGRVEELADRYEAVLRAVLADPDLAVGAPQRSR
jgi:aryl carrier-like protein